MVSKLTAISMCCILAIATSGLQADDSFEPHGAMLRYPDISAEHIVFAYANDLWLAPREGGMARPVAGPAGEEYFPRFSPDGRQIAFVGNYDGNRDIYRIPVAGGVPKRLTFHPYTERLCDWTPDGRELLFQGFGMGDHPRTRQLFRLSADGGMPVQLPVPYGGAASISPDGDWLAYTPSNRDERTWKRYRGGRASDIWLFNLRDNSARKITDWEGTDTQPMWYGAALYYLSDGGPEHRLNIWRYDPATDQRRQLTQLGDYDIKWPSIGPGAAGDGEIVFQYGAGLMTLDLATEQSRPLSISIPGDRADLRPRYVKADDLIYNRGISATGKRAVLEARGDIWTLAASEGAPRNLTRSSGIAERDPAWSPDGRWIAYFSDQRDSYDLYLTQSDGLGATRRLTDLSSAFLYAPVWAPNSEAIAFWDKAGNIYLHNIDDGATVSIDREPLNSRNRLSWSPDSRWLAYTKSHDNRNHSVWLYDTRDKQAHLVTAGMFNDNWPAFDPDGKYLYFVSNRDFSRPMYEDHGSTWIYAETDRIFLLPLRKDVPSPLLLSNDEEEFDDGSKDETETDDTEDKQETEESADAKDGAETSVDIDFENIESRAVLLPIKSGLFYFLTVNESGQILYSRSTVRRSPAEGGIKLFDPTADEPKEKTVLDGAGSYSLSADGKKILVNKNGRMAILDAAANQTIEKTITTKGLRVLLDPRAEWRQIFRESWRLYRDFFYDPTMHGVDWPAVYRQYEPMLKECITREDLSFVISEMIAELNVGHAYYGGGDTEEAPRASVGMPGVEFEPVNGAYRIARIYSGAAWDADARGPLMQPGVDVKVGDYLLAVNGKALDMAQGPLAAFQNLAGSVVSLTVSSQPELNDQARQVVVKLPGSDLELRYRAWIEAKRAYVDRQSNGRVGYIYVPNTGVDGQSDLVRQFKGQLHKAALIIDERWNGGGQIPYRFIELLNRPVASYWARRDGKDNITPPDGHHGARCMLINGHAGSGGDFLPYWFRKAGLGKLVGTRTWGGLVGLSGNPPLIDGAYCSVPTFAFYETDGTWGIEGHGVDPDIEVIDDPSLMTDGGDPQLDAAIKLMLEEIDRQPFIHAQRPAYPNRSGMGISEDDK